MSEQSHFYGGQAIIEGVMMRGKKVWAAAVRRSDGTIVTTRQQIEDYGEKYPWTRWPLIRGNLALIESLSLGFRSLIFSFNVLAEEEAEKAPEGTEVKKQQTSGWMVYLSIIPAMLIGLGLFVLLPSYIPDWLGIDESSALTKNLLEALARVIAIVGYIAVISLMPDIRRVFQYHGAEHATINCFEAGQTVEPKQCIEFSERHPRCGTSFLLLFIMIKLLLNAPLGWPVLWLRTLLRLAMIIPAAAVAYEILKIGGKHRNSWFGRLLSAPGKVLQGLTTRRPDEQQLEVAVHALALVAPEVDLPPGLTPPVEAGMDGKIIADSVEPARDEAQQPQAEETV